MSDKEDKRKEFLALAEKAGELLTSVMATCEVPCQNCAWLKPQLSYEREHRIAYQERLVALGVRGDGFGWSKDCDVPFDEACGCGANHPLRPAKVTP